MSYPKRAKGWRPITVDQRQFRWRLKIGSEEKGNSLHLQGSRSSGRQVVIALKGWFLLWDFVGHFDKLPNNPHEITPKFVSQCITFALMNGWEPEHSGSPLLLDYENNSGTLSQTDGDSCISILIDTTSDREKVFPTFRQIYPSKDI